MNRITHESVIAGTASIGLTPVVDVMLIRIETAERIWSRGPRPDPDWSFTDHAGHLHTYAKRTETLRAVTVHEDCREPGCMCEGDGYDRTEWYCRACHETIVPGVIHGPYAVDVPSRPEWRLQATSAVLTAGDGSPVPTVIETIDGAVWAGEVVLESWAIGPGDHHRSTWVGVGELTRRL